MARPLPLDIGPPQAESHSQASVSTDPPCRRVADRYDLRVALGRGANGEVWEADDTLTQRLVAVKLLGDGAASEPARVRREVSALRLLRIPGVAQMLDEGMDHGRPFLVMERVTGVPFPGSGRESWSTLAGPTLTLLETLSRVHAAGVVHRDIKPGNILVDDEGYPTLLDFGLSLGSSLGFGLTGAGRILGTPAYLAPEQILGDPLTAATDLYSVGVMLYEALSGRLPHEAGDFQTLIRTRLSETPAPIREVAPEVPPTVASALDALLARLPEDRPRSADELLGRLRGDQPADDLSHTDGRFKEVLSEVELRALFAGPDRIFHLREDPAKELFLRTAGVRSRVFAELGAWERAKLAHRVGLRYRVNRDAIARLAAGRAMLPAQPVVAEGRLFRLLAGRGPRETGDPAQIVAETLALAEPLATEGQLGRASALLAEGWHAARRGAASYQGDWGEARLLGLWVQVALSEGTPQALDRVLYELCRAVCSAGEVRALEQLVRAALTMRTTAGARALALVEDLAPFADPNLEKWRLQVRVQSARLCSNHQEEAVLASVEAWASQTAQPEARAALCDWLGRLRYRQGAFAEAAELHGKAAGGRRWVTERLGALLNRASALMEAFQFDAAFDAASEARALAESCRHAYCEARAEWLVRSALYRRGDVVEVDEDFADVAAKVGVAELEALVCLNEAAIAWRANDRDKTLAFAKRTERIWSEKGKPWGALFARTLVVAATGTTQQQALFLSLEAERCPVPGAGTQMLGLLARGCPEAASQLAAAARLLRESIPKECWSLRMDVLSVDEACAALGPI